MQPAPTASEKKFYPRPQSWFSKHVSPWVLFLLYSGVLLMGWLPGAHSIAVHGGFALAEALVVSLLVTLLTDKSVTCLTIGPEHVMKEEGGDTRILSYYDIKGFSEHTGKEGTYTRIESLPGAGMDILIGNRYEAYLEIRALLAVYVPDLDAPERKRRLLAHAKVLNKSL